MATFKYLTCLLAIALPSVGAQEQIEQDKIERISVTGSRLKGIDIEFSSPVTVITREDIDASGATRLADVLRSTTVNTYGSRKESPGGTQQGQATLNLRGLGEQRTLVLINGRRIANSAAIPDAQNINLIPLAAIESVEILKDGASSVYGADAVGGVVNIILRKNINMHNLSVSLTQPKVKGGDEKYASFYGGITNNFGNITYSAEHKKKSAVFARDYPLTNVGLSRYGYLGSYRIKAQEPNSEQRLSLIMPDPRCPNTLGQTDYPDSQIDGGYCKYNYASHAQIMPESTSNSVMIDGLWQFKSDTSIFAHVDLSINEYTGISAPTPSMGGGVYLPTMSANNPNNPTIGENIAFDSDFDGENDVYIEGPFDLDVFYRNVNGGMRQSENKDEMLNFYLGMSGDFANETAYEFTSFFNSNRSESLIKGLLRRDLFQAAIDDGSFDIFSVNSPIDEALAQSFSVDSAFDATFENLGSQVTFHANTFGDDKSEHDTVYGLEYITHDYSSVFQDEFSENQIDGRSGGGSAKGKRDIFSAFAETQYNLSKKLNLNFSLRFDHYSDFGSSLNPKLGLTYRYSPNIIFRSSIGTGFRAPSLFEMYSQPNQGFDNIRDSKPCEAIGDSDNDGTLDYQQDVISLAENHPCQPIRIEVVKTGNKDLKAEKSGSFTTGFTYEKTNDNRFHFNLYYQYFDNEINFLSNDDVLEREGKFGQNKRVIRDEHGSLIRILNTYGNFSGSKTAGIDLEYDLSWQTKSYGLFKWSIDFTSVLFHKVEIIPGQGFTDINGDLGNTESRLNTSLYWYFGDWKTLLSADFLPGTDENGIELKSTFVTNLRTQYRFNKHISISFGVDNFLDSEPPSSQALGWPYYMVDELVQGRTLYFNASYTF